MSQKKASPQSSSIFHSYDPDDIPPHLKQLEDDVAHARGVLERKDRVDFSYYRLKCKDEAQRGQDIKRLAPFEVKGPGEYSRQLLRFYFLQTISEIAPRVWEELRDGPYDIYYKLDNPDKSIREVENILAYKADLPNPSVFDDEYHRLIDEHYERSGESITWHLLAFLINLRRNAWFGNIPGWELKLIPEDSNWAGPDLLLGTGLMNEGPCQDDFRQWEALTRAEEAYAFDLIPLRDSLLNWANNGRGRDLTADWFLEWSLDRMYLWKIYGVRPQEQICEPCKPLTLPPNYEPDFSVERCSRCWRLLDAFDHRRIAEDADGDPEFLLPDGLASVASISREDYLEFIERKAEEHIRSSSILSIAEDDHRKKFIKRVREAADRAYIRKLRNVWNHRKYGDRPAAREK